jgi:hypothetical protein
VLIVRGAAVWGLVKPFIDEAITTILRLPRVSEKAEVARRRSSRHTGRTLPAQCAYEIIRGVWDKSPNRPASSARPLVIEATYTL